MDTSTQADKRLLDIIDLRNGLVHESDPLLRDIGICHYLTTKKYLTIVGQADDQAIYGVTTVGMDHADTVKRSLGN